MAPTGLQGQAAGTFAALVAGRDWNRLPVDTVRARLEHDGVPVSISADEAHTKIEKRPAALTSLNAPLPIQKVRDKPPADLEET
jgi:hypothetical protein